jgi:hypothetical protein
VSVALSHDTVQCSPETRESATRSEFDLCLPRLKQRSTFSSSNAWHEASRGSRQASKLTSVPVGRKKCSGVTSLPSSIRRTTLSGRGAFGEPSAANPTILSPSSPSWGDEAAMAVAWAPAGISTRGLPCILASRIATIFSDVSFVSEQNMDARKKKMSPDGLVVGSCTSHGSHPQDLDGPMRVAAQRKTNAYKQTYADNQNISSLPAIMSTSNRMHGKFLRLLFLQAHRETEAHFTAAGMPSQRNQSESFRFKRAAFYQGLKSKVGLAAAKAAALRINLNVQDCNIVADPMLRLVTDSEISR